ncbi:MAG: hypothetical protein DRH56_01180 [Deltaproteobacteria bacterium]|nr:MAG: hypothetical protein DRH56_01180 [Deltaproteobacteria bacterium]
MALFSCRFLLRRSMAGPAGRLFASGWKEGRPFLTGPAGRPPFFPPARGCRPEPVDGFVKIPIARCDPPDRIEGLFIRQDDAIFAGAGALLCKGVPAV